MPNYTYICQKCQKEFTLYATFEEYDKKDPKKFSCPKCGSTDIKQNIGGFLFITGSGSSGGFNPRGGMSGCGPVCGPGTC